MSETIPLRDSTQELVDLAKNFFMEFEGLKASINALKVAYCVQFARSPDDVPALLGQIDEYKQQLIGEKFREIDLIAEMLKRRVRTGSSAPDA